MSKRTLDLSVVIVNYNVKHFAEQCLRSIYAAVRGLQIELFLVDNNSTDGSLDYLQPRFPGVNFIANRENLGFGRANNIALKRTSGRYILVLNPDTLLADDTLQALIEYMDAHPRVGAVGPKILNRDGSFDIGSKRGLPTPWAAFCRLSGLIWLFPHSRLFGRYYMLHLDPDKPAEIDALVGSCMMVRREAYEQVGGFDEDFFMYGEDIDWCYRMKLAGWEIHYAPVTRIVHFVGESTRRSEVDRDKAFYGAMHLFVDKHFRGRYPLATHRLIDLGIILAKTAARLKHLWRRVYWPLLDWAGLWGVLALGRLIRWGAVGLSWPVAFALALQATVWTLCIAGLKGYGRLRGQMAPLAGGMLLGFLINSSFTYFFKQFAYSRFVNLFGLVIGGLFVWGWRMMLKRFRRTTAWRRFYRRRTLIVGVGSAGRMVLKRLQSGGDLPYHPVGFIDPQESSVGTLIDGLPVLGVEDELAQLVTQEEIEEVLFAYNQVDYNRVLEAVNQIGKRRGVNFKVISPESAAEQNGLIPLLSVEYLSPRGLGSSLRKIGTILKLKDKSEKIHVKG